MQLFYSTDIHADKIFLSSEESNHAKNVLRLKEGDSIKVINGNGGTYDCKISAAKPKLMELDIITCITEGARHPYHLHIAIAPTKNIDRIEWFVEKTTEIGIDEISFIQTQRSERKHINIERMKKIAIAAMKQSVKSYLPTLNEMQTFENFVSNKSIPTSNTKLYIAHLEDDRKFLKDVIKPTLNQPAFNTIILIGPEGDFCANEISLAYKNNYLPISLGNYRLRTETAGIVACTTVSLMLELLQE